MISIRRSAAEREKEEIAKSGQEPAPEMIRKMIETRKQLQALQGVRFHLKDEISAEE